MFREMGWYKGILVIVPCNRYFPDEYKYGNINNYNDISQCFYSKAFENPLIKVIQRREKCKSCKIYDFCNSGCNNVALNQGGIENKRRFLFIIN